MLALAKWSDQLWSVDEIKQLTEAVLRFRDARDWAQFHNAKDLAAQSTISRQNLWQI